ncbi:MAG: Cna B-type domain-containing protein [Peptoniphilus harei]|nr:Cna B-type domain-containing protein [Peptoniphilus harei]
MLKCKKITAFFLACLMLLGTIVPTGEAFAQGANHLSKTRISRIEVKDRKGNTIDLNEKIEEDKDCRLEIDWDASEYGAGIKKGDYFNVTLPKDFKASKSNFAVHTLDGVQVAKAQINNPNSESGGGTLKVVFTSLVEDETDVKGSIAIEGSLLSTNNSSGENQINNSSTLSTSISSSVNSSEESNIVKLDPIEGKVSGISWEDKNQNGTYTEGEKLLANTKVKLMKVNEDGSLEVAKDTEGKEYIATTDENGHYEFNVYNKGKYFVEMIRPDNYKTTKNVEGSDKGNHMSDNLDEENNNSYINSSSKEFDLNRNHREQIVNGGWYKNTKEITLDIPLIKILGLPKTNPDEMRETLSYLVNDAPKDWTFNFKIEALSENKEVEKEEQRSITIENQLKQFAGNKDRLYKMISKMMDRDIKSLDDLSDEEIDILYDIARSLLAGPTHEEFLEYTYEITEGEAREFTFRITELSSNYKLVKNDRYNERYHYFKYDGQNERNIYEAFHTNYEDLGESVEELVRKIWETNLGEDFNSYFGSISRAEEYLYNLNRDYDLDLWYGLGGDSRRVYILYPFINSIKKQPWTPMEPPVREIKVKKEFKASNGEAIKSPVDEIEVELFKNGQATGNRLTLNDENNWAGKFENLPVYESLEKTGAFTYTVKEVGEENGIIKLTDKSFNVSYTGDMKDGFTITNKEEPTIPPTPLNPPKEDLKVEKIWQDKEGKEIAVPVKEIEVELYRDGKATDKKLTLNAENNWTGEFKDLDVVEKLDSEKAYEYTVKEVGEEKGKVVIGSNKYEVKYSGSMEDGFTITNEEEPTIPPTPLNPPKEDIKVEKIWQDKDGKEIAAPVEKIEVELYRDGKATGKKLELNKANKWSGEFKDLDVVEKLDSKEAYKYSVKEVGEETGSIKLKGNWYKVSYSGSMKDGFTITNKEEPKTPPTPPTPSEPDTINIKVKKDWTLYGNKPVDKIVVELYRDGEATGKLLDLNKDNNWSGEFKNLDVKESANSTHDYHYTVKEIGETGNTIKLDGRWFDVNYLGNMKDGFTIVNKEEKPREPGKPEEPNTPNKPNDPQEPNTPETPKEPEKPNNPGTPVTPKTPKTPLPGKPLPKTGNGLNPSTYAWILLGLGNLSTFAGIQRKKRINSRRKKNVK